MVLKEYERKRDFSRTPEPRPRKRRSPAGWSYLIQKHAATRLHYDFRLELDGVLLSWAVTRGPSLDPRDKRLAVRTEDHPLDYGTFEGTIPKGEYGGGTVMLWDRGSWEPKGDPHAGLEAGQLSFVLHGERLQGEWALIRMQWSGKQENWLLIKHKDAEARTGAAADLLSIETTSVVSGRSMAEIAGGKDGKPKPAKTATAKQPASAGRSIERLVKQYPEVQLATLVSAPPAGDEWLHEIKFDGIRLLGFVAGGAARLLTRNGKDWTDHFPALASSLAALPVTDAVLDLEAVVLDAAGKSSFQGLQSALTDGRQVVGYGFDLLHLDRQDLTALPLLERKAKLQELLERAQAPALHFSDHVLGDGEALFVKACKRGLEGLVSKRARAAYVPGRHGDWLKTKCIQRQEFIILGYSNARRGSRALGALYLGYRKDDELRYAGKVGTGFTMRGASALVARLAPLASDKAALARSAMTGLTAAETQGIHWVKPELLCEVAFTEWTRDGRIRHPSFQGLRDDKDAGEVVQEKPVAPRKVAAKAPRKAKNS
ncbi:MAG TPA: non-homologous end-joining DNA ligase [Candidatus Udaeobacter sp.]|nr:non-homologous end-joining DNA ligase [Candidatus Udaeobacter sp.]